MDGRLSVCAGRQLALLNQRAGWLAIGDSDGQLLAVYHAEPGSDSAGWLGLLGSLAATEEADEAAAEAGAARDRRTSPRG